MDFNEMYRAILEIFPGAQCEEDNDGQLVIYTDMRVDEDNQVIPFEDDDVEYLREF